jgi:zinc transporter 1
VRTGCVPNSVIFVYQAMGRLSGKTCRLVSMMALTGSFFLVELIFGYISNSLALVGDSYHMLSDLVALIVGLASVRVSGVDFSIAIVL